VVASSDAEVASFTEFELLTAMSFVLFSEARVDFAVLEVGLGGRWDATNIVDEAVAVICGIGLDHQAILGETLEAIAAEKAAIIKPATSVVLGPATSEVQQVFLDRVEACDAGLCVVSPCGNRLFPDVIPELTVTYEGVATSDGLSFSVAGRHARYDGLVLPAAPSYQLANAACAVAAAEGALGRALDAKSVREAFSSCTFPGRFAVLTDDPLLIVDGAHNPQGASALARAIDERFSGQRRPVLLLAVLADKDARGIVDALAPHVADIVVTQTSSTRARPCRELADLVESRIGHRPAVYASVTDAVDALVVRGDGTPVVAAGSITLAAELTRLFG
ncbi:MAG: bifunctional folylpolyglutamate synthase/dihydrofolate synthase, partial [Coriobacteriales bacterium]